MRSVVTVVEGTGNIATQVEDEESRVCDLFDVTVGRRKNVTHDEKRVTDRFHLNSYQRFYF